MAAELPYRRVRVEHELAGTRWSARLREWIDREGVLALLVCCYAAAIFPFSQWLLSTDSWYALTAGRLIALHGLPTHDTLTVFAHGRRWVDQQWLGQLAIYGVDRIGGIRLTVFVHAFLLVGALAAAVALARRRRARGSSVALVTGVALLPLLLSTLQLRTQSFAYLPFVAVLAIVAGRLTWPRIAIVLAILALWANLHGSVFLGAALVALRGLTDVAVAVRGRRLPGPRALLLVVLPWACLLATPFPLGMPHYYAQTIFNPTLSHYLAQWQPSTLSAVSVPLFALAFGFVWLLARGGSELTLFEKLAGLALVALALIAVRNWVWLSLFAVALYPKALDRARATGPATPPAALNRVCAVAGLVLAVGASAAALAHSDSWFTKKSPDAAAAAVAKVAAAHPHDRIWASVRWGDWLLWKQPQLAGRIAYDARSEILTSAQVRRIVLMRITPALLPAARRQYKIFLVDRADEPTVFAALRHQGRVAYDDGEVLVVSFPRA